MRSPFLTTTLAMLTTLAATVTPDRAAAADPPGRIGRLSYLSGGVQFTSGSQSDWTTGALNYPITSGDGLRSGDDSKAEVEIGSSIVQLAPQTTTRFLEVSDDVTHLSLAGGALDIRTREIASDERYDIDEPDGTVSLLEAGHYRLDVSPDGRESRITVRDGSAKVYLGSSTLSVKSGQSALLTGPSSMVTIAVQPDSWERWCDSRDLRADGAVSLRYVSPGLVGFEDLDHYGVWRIEAALGPVWAPAVPQGWVPYRSGHWASIDPWGWTWIDDDPWGFAPFHYGRWAFLGGSWVWVPGRLVEAPVYAPALVAFVGGPALDFSLSFGSGGGVAWFPLGPREAFVPAYAVSRAYIRQVNIATVGLTDVEIAHLNPASVRYVNRSVAGATTAVSQHTFLAGESVSRGAVRVPTSALSRATVGSSTPVRSTGTSRVAARPSQSDRDEMLGRQDEDRMELERRQQAELDAARAAESRSQIEQRQATERGELARHQRAEADSLDRREHRRSHG